MLKKILAAIAALALSAGFVVATGVAAADAAVTPATSVATSVVPQCIVDVINHPAVKEVSHQEYQYDKIIPGTAEVSHQEWRYRTRTVTYGYVEHKFIDSKWDFQSGGSTTIAGHGTVSGHWVNTGTLAWRSIPDSVINAVWGSGGIPDDFIGGSEANPKGDVPLSSYGAPSSAGDAPYYATKVLNPTGYTDWGPWSGYSATQPTSSDTVQVDTPITVVDSNAVAEYTVYYVQGSSPSISSGDASWITASTLSGWTLFNQKKVIDTAAADASVEDVYGDCPTVVPAVPEVKDTCGTDNDHYVLPTGPAGIIYSRSALPGRDIIATITAANTYWGTLPAGWVQNTATTATYAFDNTKFTNVDCYPPVKCVLSGTSDTEAGDLAPVQGLAGLVFDGPTAVGQAKDIYYRVLSGNAQGITGMSVSYSGTSTVFPAQVVVEIWRTGVVGTNFATLSTNFSAAEATGTVDVQNSGEWYTSKISTGPGSLDWISTGHTETYAQLIANYPSNLLASAPSLHLQSNSPAGAHSVVSSLTSSCGPLGFSLVHVASSVSHTDQTCNVDKNLVGGTITVGITNHVTYTIKDSSMTVVPFDAGTGATGVLPPGTYTVTAIADTGYGLDPDISGTVVISAYGDACVKVISVAPEASASDQICSAVTNHLENGLITVAIKPGVDYQIWNAADATHTLIPFDGSTGKTAALPPGSYTVHPTAESGYALTSTADIPLTIAPYGDLCLQLITHPLVDPSAAQVQIGCNTAGSYTLSSDQVDPTAVVWTVNLSTVSQGTYTVGAAGHYVIDAAPGPGYGFAFGTTTHWVYDFAPPTTCELKTLALTGSAPEGALVLAGFLLLFGLVLARRSVARKATRN